MILVYIEYRIEMMKPLKHHRGWINFPKIPCAHRWKIVLCAVCLYMYLYVYIIWKHFERCTVLLKSHLVVREWVTIGMVTQRNERRQTKFTTGANNLWISSIRLKFQTILICIYFLRHTHREWEREKESRKHIPFRHLWLFVVHAKNIILMVASGK